MLELSMRPTLSNDRPAVVLEHLYNVASPHDTDINVRPTLAVCSCRTIDYIVPRCTCNREVEARLLVVAAVSTGPSQVG